MLDRKQLQKLRNDICLGSLYTHDYRNSYNIPEIQTQDFFEGFMEYMYDLERKETSDGKLLSAVKFFKKYDTIDNLENWYYCYEEDPLSKEFYDKYFTEEK